MADSGTELSTSIRVRNINNNIQLFINATQGKKRELLLLGQGLHCILRGMVA